MHALFTWQGGFYNIHGGWVLTAPCMRAPCCPPPLPTLTQYMQPLDAPPPPSTPTLTQYTQLLDGPPPVHSHPTHAPPCCSPPPTPTACRPHSSPPVRAEEDSQRSSSGHWSRQPLQGRHGSCPQEQKPSLFKYPNERLSLHVQTDEYRQIG